MKSWLLKLLLATLSYWTLSSASVDAAEASRTWEGTWINRKYDTKGPLKCVATLGKKGTWKATFSGTFENDPFTYKVTFQSKGRSSQQKLKGTATIRGHKYEWEGLLKGKQLAGRYRANIGYYGEFELREKSGKGASK